MLKIGDFFVSSTDRNSLVYAVAGEQRAGVALGGRPQKIPGWIEHHLSVHVGLGHADENRGLLFDIRFPKAW